MLFPLGDGPVAGFDVGVRWVVKPLLILPPENVMASDEVYPSKVAVTWDVVPNAATYEVWRNKFLKHRHTDELATRDIPFAFYRDSIFLFQSDPTGGPNEVRWAAAA